MLKNNLHGCTFIDHNGIKCDGKGHSSNIAFKSHRVSKNCPNMLKQDLNENHSKQMIIDEIEQISKLFLTQIKIYLNKIMILTIISKALKKKIINLIITILVPKKFLGTKSLSLKNKSIF